MSKTNTQVNFHQPYLVNLINKLKAEDTTRLTVAQNYCTGEVICEPSFVRNTVSVPPFIFHINIVKKRKLPSPKHSKIVWSKA